MHPLLLFYVLVSISFIARNRGHSPEVPPIPTQAILVMAKKKKAKIKRTPMSKGQAQTWISNIANQVSELTSSQLDILAQEIGPYAYAPLSTGDHCKLMAQQVDVEKFHGDILR